MYGYVGMWEPGENLDQSRKFMITAGFAATLFPAPGMDGNGK